MEYLSIVGTVLAIVGGTFCFAALQWPRLFTTAWRAPVQLDPTWAAWWPPKLRSGNA
jgi:hypothetical protein